MSVDKTATPAKQAKKARSGTKSSKSRSSTAQKGTTVRKGKKSTPAPTLSAGALPELTDTVIAGAPALGAFPLYEELKAAPSPAPMTEEEQIASMSRIKHLSVEHSTAIFLIIEHWAREQGVPKAGEHYFAPALLGTSGGVTYRISALPPELRALICKYLSLIIKE